MRPFGWYNINVYHITGNRSNSRFSENAQNTFLGVLTSNISINCCNYFIFGDFLWALDIRAEKLNPSKTIWGGGAR